jgi:acyl-CoA dehydrogenase
MMNNARLLVGVQGVALATRAMQAAVSFGKDRKQGRSAASGDLQSTIIHHPDVKRMLVEMRAKTSAARMLCMATAAAIDAGESQKARAALLTPLAKSYATDIAVEVASSAVQVHGGMGFVEDTGVAQYYRDARILPIYEGTNGIQAIDLVTRKLTLENGATLNDIVTDSTAAVAKHVGHDHASKLAARFNVINENLRNDPGSAASLAVATPFTRALATLVAAGLLGNAAEMAKGTVLQAEAETDARYFSTVDLPASIATLEAVWQGANLLLEAAFE